MKKEKYTKNDIEIGDEIMFDDNYKVEHNLFWKVINFFSDNRVIVEIREMGYAEKLIIEIRDIIVLQRRGLQLEEIGC